MATTTNFAWSNCVAGLNPDQKSMETMLKDCPGQLNFTSFLTLFGEKLHGKAPRCRRGGRKPEATMHHALVHCLSGATMLYRGTCVQCTRTQAFVCGMCRPNALTCGLVLYVKLAIIRKVPLLKKCIYSFQTINILLLCDITMTQNLESIIYTSLY